MRSLITTFATLSFGILPIAAQNPVRPAPPPPAQQGGAVMPLTAEQRQQQQAIREKYAKQLQDQRDAMQALNEKMRAEITGTLTPEQRARMPQGGGAGMQMRGGDMGGMGNMMGAQPPQNDIYARPGGMMRNRARAMMRTRARGREFIIVRPRRAMRGRQAMRGRPNKPGRAGKMQMQPMQPMSPQQQKQQMQMMKRGGGMMGHSDSMMVGMPPKPAPAKKPVAPKKTGGGTQG